MIGSKRVQFTVSITCPQCGQAGSIASEEDDGMTPSMRGKRTLIRVSNGFHAEVGRTDPGDDLIICDHCDEIQAD
jgi:hypothetical protein